MSTVPHLKTFQQAVAEVSGIAHAKLPQTLHGRLERATALVIQGAVWASRKNWRNFWR